MHPPRPRRTSFLAAVLIAGAVAVTVPVAVAVASLPAPVAARDYGLKEVGRGQLRWLGFGIYEASLWSRDGRFQGVSSEQPLALSLWYQRKFTRDELVKITRDEWDRLQLGTPAARERWAAELRRMWQDVARGDNLTAVVVPGEGTRFYDARRPLGTVADPEFGPAFLAIWLDPRTAVRDLRAQLLGSGR